MRSKKNSTVVVRRNGCWALKANLRFCNRKGDWAVLCDEHRSPGYLFRSIASLLGLLATIITLITFRGCPNSSSNPPVAVTPLEVGSVDIDLTLHNESLDSSATQASTLAYPSPYQTTVKYSHERSNTDLKIIYQLPYLNSLSSGMLLETFGAIAADSKFTWKYPKLAVKVVNNTNRTVFFTDAQLEVLGSSINKDPIPVIMRKHEYEYQGIIYEAQLGAFDIVNEGWGQIVNAVVDYEAKAKGGTKCSFKGGKASLLLGTVSERTRIVVWSPATQEECSRAGESKRIEIAGVMRYETEDHQKRRSEFRTALILGIERHPLGITRVSAVYDVMLEAGKSNHVRNIPIAHQIKPGETDNFIFQIGVDKSGHFDVRLSLREASGVQLAAKRVFLDIFRPRSSGTPKTSP